MELINPNRDILEIIYLASGPLVLVIACFGLYQLWLAKEQIKVSKELAQISSKRDAFEITAQQCNYFASTIIPLYDEFNKHIGNKPYFNQLAVVDNAGKFNLSLHPNLKDKREEIIEAFNSSKPMTLSNSVEGYAMYFTSGIASEELAYTTTGLIFCTIVDKISPLLKPYFDRGQFQHLRELKGIWQNKIDSQSLMKQKAVIEEKLSQKKTMSIQPIGS